MMDENQTVDTGIVVILMQDTGDETLDYVRRQLLEALTALHGYIKRLVDDVVDCKPFVRRRVSDRTFVVSEGILPYLDKLDNLGEAYRLLAFRHRLAAEAAESEANDGTTDPV